MPTIIRPSELEFAENKSELSEFKWHSCIPRLSTLTNSKHMVFDVRSLDPGKYSYPYHFHRNSEEIFVIFSGSVTLRTPEGLQELKQGDIAFFEMGNTGTHQLYNPNSYPCTYLDIRTTVGPDVCEYPDSGKIAILPYMEMFEKNTQVEYSKGEENVSQVWELLKKA
jgi:uncharacterized cupin superfamily protein